jgi:transposase
VRKPLPAALPRIEVIHDLGEGEKLCADDGQALVAIGEEVSEQLDIVPAQVRVLRHVRKKYACPRCQQGIKTALLPPQPIPKSLASPGLLAHVAVAKYQDALPLYRQERILKRIGVELPRATLASWMLRLGPVIQPLINLMRAAVLAYDIVQMDETTVQVLNEPGRSAHSPSYLWVQRGGPPEHPLILYEYDPSHSQDVPKRLLDGYHGYLQIDGYEGYNAVCRTPGIKALGCWAHARRKFDEALKAQGKVHARPTRAHQGLTYIQELYRIEQEVKGTAPEVRYHLRQQKAKPLLDEIRLWLDAALPEIPPTSATGRALYYLHHQWGETRALSRGWAALHR